MGEALGLNRSSIANIEAGRQLLYAHSILPLASLLGVDPAELLGMAARSGPQVAYRAEFRETIRDTDGGISSWSMTDDLNKLITRMAMQAQYAPVAEVRTATTFYGEWQRISLAPPNEGDDTECLKTTSPI